MKRIRLHQRGRQFALLASAIVLVVATLLLASSYRFSASQVEEAQALVTEMYSLSATEWESIATLSVGQTEFDELDEATVRVTQLADELLAEGTIDTQTRRLLDSFIGAVNAEFDLLADGQIEAALELDETSVDPLFDSVIEDVEAAVDAARRRAASANLVATIGLIIAVAVAVIIAAILVRRLERTRNIEANVAAKDQFLAAVSHEIRTPLTAVRGFAEVLDTDSSLYDVAERSEMIEMIVDQTREMSHIIEDLLVGARSEVGSLSIKAEDIDLGGLVAHTVNGIRRPESTIVDVDVPRGCVVNADPGRLRQILRNLLTNAYRYGGPHVTIRARDAAGRTWLDVTDDGSGVPEAERERIFEAYAQASDEHTAGSVGIGLHISQQLAELMDAKITYLHNPLSATFRVDLASGQRHRGHAADPSPATASPAA